MRPLPCEGVSSAYTYTRRQPLRRPGQRGLLGPPSPCLTHALGLGPPPGFALCSLQALSSTTRSASRRSRCCARCRCTRQRTSCGIRMWCPAATTSAIAAWRCPSSTCSSSLSRRAQPNAHTRLSRLVIGVLACHPTPPPPWALASCLASCLASRTPWLALCTRSGLPAAQL